MGQTNYLDIYLKKYLRPINFFFIYIDSVLVFFSNTIESNCTSYRLI